MSKKRTRYSGAGPYSEILENSEVVASFLKVCGDKVEKKEKERLERVQEAIAGSFSDTIITRSVERFCYFYHDNRPYDSLFGDFMKFYFDVANKIREVNIGCCKKLLETYNEEDIYGFEISQVRDLISYISMIGIASRAEVPEDRVKDILNKLTKYIIFFQLCPRNTLLQTVLVFFANIEEASPGKLKAAILKIYSLPALSPFLKADFPQISSSEAAVIDRDSWFKLQLLLDKPTSTVSSFGVIIQPLCDFVLALRVRKSCESFNTARNCVMRYLFLVTDAELEELLADPYVCFKRILDIFKNTDPNSFTLSYMRRLDVTKHRPKGIFLNRQKMFKILSVTDSHQAVKLLCDFICACFICFREGNDPKEYTPFDVMEFIDVWSKNPRFSFDASTLSPASPPSLVSLQPSPSSSLPPLPPPPLLPLPPTPTQLPDFPNPLFLSPKKTPLPECPYFVIHLHRISETAIDFYTFFHDSTLPGFDHPFLNYFFNTSEYVNFLKIIREYPTPEAVLDGLLTKLKNHSEIPEILSRYIEPFVFDIKFVIDCVNSCRDRSIGDISFEETLKSLRVLEISAIIMAHVLFKTPVSEREFLTPKCVFEIFSGYHKNVIAGAPLPPPPPSSSLPPPPSALFLQTSNLTGALSPDTLRELDEAFCWLIRLFTSGTDLLNRDISDFEILLIEKLCETRIPREESGEICMHTFKRELYKRAGRKIKPWVLGGQLPCSVLMVREKCPRVVSNEYSPNPIQLLTFLEAYVIGCICAFGEKGLQEADNIEKILKTIQNAPQTITVLVIPKKVRSYPDGYSFNDDLRNFYVFFNNGGDASFYSEEGERLLSFLQLSIIVKDSSRISPLNSYFQRIVSIVRTLNPQEFTDLLDFIYPFSFPDLEDDSSREVELTFSQCSDCLAKFLFTTVVFFALRVREGKKIKDTSNSQIIAFANSLPAFYLATQPKPLRLVSASVLPTTSNDVIANILIELSAFFQNDLHALIPEELQARHLTYMFGVLFGKNPDADLSFLSLNIGDPNGALGEDPLVVTAIRSVEKHDRRFLEFMRGSITPFLLSMDEIWEILKNFRQNKQKYFLHLLTILQKINFLSFCLFRDPEINPEEITLELILSSATESVVAPLYVEPTGVTRTSPIIALPAWQPTLPPKSFGQFVSDVYQISLYLNTSQGPIDLSTCPLTPVILNFFGEIFECQKTIDAVLEFTGTVTCSDSVRLYFKDLLANRISFFAEKMMDTCPGIYKYLPVCDFNLDNYVTFCLNPSELHFVPYVLRSFLEFSVGHAFYVFKTGEPVYNCNLSKTKIALSLANGSFKGEIASLLQQEYDKMPPKLRCACLPDFDWIEMLSSITNSVCRINTRDPDTLKNEIDRILLEKLSVFHHRVNIDYRLSFFNTPTLKPYLEDPSVNTEVVFRSLSLQILLLKSFGDNFPLIQLNRFPSNIENLFLIILHALERTTTEHNVTSSGREEAFRDLFIAAGRDIFFDFSKPGQFMMFPSLAKPVMPCVAPFPKPPIILEPQDVQALAPFVESLGQFCNFLLLLSALRVQIDSLDRLYTEEIQLYYQQLDRFLETGTDNVSKVLKNKPYLANNPINLFELFAEQSFAEQRLADCKRLFNLKRRILFFKNLHGDGCRIAEVLLNSLTPGELTEGLSHLFMLIEIDIEDEVFAIYQRMFEDPPKLLTKDNIKDYFTLYDRFSKCITGQTVKNERIPISVSESPTACVKQFQEMMPFLNFKEIYIQNASDVEHAL